MTQRKSFTGRKTFTERKSFIAAAIFGLVIAMTLPACVVAPDQGHYAAGVAWLRRRRRAWKLPAPHRTPDTSGSADTGIGSAVATSGFRAAGWHPSAGVTGSITAGCGTATAGACIPVIGNAASRLPSGGPSRGLVNISEFFRASACIEPMLD